MPPELYLARPDRYERSNAQDCRPRPGEAERFLRTGAVRLPLINGTCQADDLFPNRSPPFTVYRSLFAGGRAVGSEFGVRSLAWDGTDVSAEVRPLPDEGGGRPSHERTGI